VRDFLQSLSDEDAAEVVAALSPADSQVPAVHPALEESSGRTV
jgi:methyl coenzyme M reductase gamma subunit